MKVVVIISILMMLLSLNTFANIQIIGGLTNTNIEMFFINDFNLIQTGNSPQIFWLKITNSYPESRQVILRLIFRYIGASSMSGSDLLVGETNQFELMPGMLTITNQDFFSDGDKFSLNDPEFNESAANDLMQSILTTGKLPSGKYEFIISVIEYGSNNVYGEEIIEINLSNPTTLDLLSPGTSAAMTDLMEIYTTQPLFRWESDAHKFRLRICEQLSINSSPEDVMQNEPRFLKEEDLTSTSYQYQPSDVFPLEEGKTYFWQVFAIVNSSNGEIEYPSEIWGFKIANLSNVQNTVTHLQVMNYLRLILGSEIYDQLFQEGGELAGFSATGLVLKNGASVNLEELNTFINKIFSGEINIKNYAVE